MHEMVGRVFKLILNEQDSFYAAIEFYDEDNESLSLKTGDDPYLLEQELRRKAFLD